MININVLRLNVLLYIFNIVHVIFFYFRWQVHWLSLTYATSVVISVLIVIMREYSQCACKIGYSNIIHMCMSIPMAARSKPWVCGNSLAGIASSNFAGAWISVSCECFEVAVCTSG
jgi:hypothetical protein